MGCVPSRARVVPEVAAPSPKYLDNELKRAADEKKVSEELVVTSDATVSAAVTHTSVEQFGVEGKHVNDEIDVLAVGWIKELHEDKNDGNRTGTIEFSEPNASPGKTQNRWERVTFPVPMHDFLRENAHVKFKLRKDDSKDVPEELAFRTFTCEITKKRHSFLHLKCDTAEYADKTSTIYLAKQDYKADFDKVEKGKYVTCFIAKKDSKNSKHKYDNAFYAHEKKQQHTMIVNTEQFLLEAKKHNLPVAFHVDPSRRTDDEEKLISRHENKHCEFKKAEGGREGLQNKVNDKSGLDTGKTVCGFFNDKTLKGGVLLYGIIDKRGKLPEVSGVGKLDAADIDSIKSMFEQLLVNSKKMQPLPTPQDFVVGFIPIMDKPSFYVVVLICRSRFEKEFAVMWDGCFYVRYEVSTRLLNTPKHVSDRFEEFNEKKNKDKDSLVVQLLKEIHQHVVTT